jgi:hypothetical protein
VTLRLGDAAALPVGADFVFPTSQSGILPANPAGPGFVLLERIEGNPIALELHGSLQWKGRSGATHELDVSMLPRSIAGPLRTSGGHPRGLPIVAYECKDRTNSATPDEMRQTVARLFDLALVTRPYPAYDCRMFEAASHQRWGRRRTLYREFFAVGAFGVVRAGTFGPGATDLGMHYHVGRHEQIYNAGAIGDVEARFVQVLEQVDLI